MANSEHLSSDYMAALAEVEAHFPVVQWNVCGIPIWPQCRVRWMFSEWIESRRDIEAARPRLVSLANQAFGLAGDYAQLSWDVVAHSGGHERQPMRRDVLFLSDGVSFANTGGEWTERFCDPLIARFAAAGLTSVLWTPLRKPRWPRRSRTKFVQPGVDRATLAALLARRTSDDARLPGHADVCAALVARGFGTATLAIDRICSHARRMRAIADYYAVEIRRVAPRLAFIVSFYSLEGLAFVLACRELAIPVVDLQHGVQGEMHPAYACWPVPPATGHALLPDVFWVWSAYEAEVIERWSAGSRHRALIGGNPWLDVWRSGSDWKGVAQARSAARALRERAGARPVVLVTLQFGLASATQLEPLARLIALAAPKLAFWVRLHPAMLDEREQVRGAFAGDFELDVPTDLPLHALLGCVDVHLTHSSSTVIEAAQFGIGSVLTSVWGGEIFAAQVANGTALIETGESAAVAAACMRQASSGRDPGTNATNTEAPVAELIRSITA